MIPILATTITEFSVYTVQVTELDQTFDWQFILPVNAQSAASFTDTQCPVQCKAAQLHCFDACAQQTSRDSIPL